VPDEQRADDVCVNIHAALHRYRKAPLFIRCFTFGRHLLAPLERIAVHVPPQGSILDVGCGHGLFSNMLALATDQRHILGIDPSGAKINIALRSSQGLQNIEYRRGTIDEVAEKDFQAISILDVLYLLPDEKKLEVLRACRNRLASDGVLLLKTNDTHPRWKYAVVRAEEELMVRTIGFTYGGEVHFRGVPRYLELLRQAGFDAQVISLDSWLPVPHRLFLARPVE
jgi:2-polyprenyl-3-methyl-5-hydroxy-6-metoxy-1,4-benzoquinol methylase